MIFDTHVDACVTPDQARRPDCKANKFLGFECPTYKPEELSIFVKEKYHLHETRMKLFS